MHRTATLLLTLLFVATLATAGIDRTSGHIGVVAEIKGRSIPENSIDRVGVLAPDAPSAVDAFDAAMIAAPIDAGPIGFVVAESAADNAAPEAKQKAEPGPKAGAIAWVNSRVTDSTSGGVASETTPNDFKDVIVSFLNLLDDTVTADQASAGAQAFNTLTNVQKSKHDAAMAAIQNTR